MRPVDADALKEEVNKKKVVGRFNVLSLIDAAQTIPLPDFKEGYCQAILDGKTNYSRPRGKWTDLSTDGRHTGWIACSVCGQEPPSESNLRTDFCPNCGADLREDDNEYTDPVIKAIQENNAKYNERPSIDFSRMSCDLGENNEVKKNETDN